MNISFIGYGASAIYFHLPIIKDISTISLTAVFDPVKDNQIQGIKDGFEFSFGTENLINDLISSKTEICVICSPSNFHYEQAKISLSNKIHTIVEKPLCMNDSELNDLITIANDNQVLLCPFHNRRFDNDFKKVSSMLSNKLLGEIKRIDLSVSEWGLSNKFASPKFNPNWRLQKKYGGGMFNDWMPHLIDKLMLIMNYQMPKHIQSIKTANYWTKDCDDFVTIQYYWDYVVARILISSLDAFPMERMRISGTEGSIVVDGNDQEGNIFIKVKTYYNKFNYKNNSMNARIFYEEFIKAVQGNNSEDLPIKYDEFTCVYELINKTSKLSITNNYDM
jgi:predicted dehydrogenase